MNLTRRLLEAAQLVPQDVSFADIGTDHAYLPVYLVEQGKIAKAIAGDIVPGPCQAARNTVALYNMNNVIEVRQGSGLQVLASGEAECIAICGMGAATIIDILEESFSLACEAKRLILQPMAGAPLLRKYLVTKGWSIVAESLAEEPGHLYEIIAVERGTAIAYTELDYVVGPLLLRQKHPLLHKQLVKQISNCLNLKTNMEKSEAAIKTEKYQKNLELLKKLEALADACNS